MLTKSLIEKIFGAAHMTRWIDHLRPVELTELDKQAHKMIIAWVLGRLAADAGRTVDWDRLVEGGIFELLRRITLTDLKPSVYDAVMERRAAEVNALVTSHVALDLAAVGDGRLVARLDVYLARDDDCLERSILQCAHALATAWEFRIIYAAAPFMYGAKETKQRLERNLADLAVLPGAGALSPGAPLDGFIDLVGQLRFQKRWAQTPRIPATSVLGHLLFVGVLAYLSLVEVGACPRRRYNGFFGGLTHDLPEILTRDIVSPLKRSVPGLEALIKEHEEQEMGRRLLPLLPPAWHDEIRYFTEDEFEDRIVERGKKRLLAPGGITGPLDDDAWNPADGAIIEAVDKLAAYLEASASLAHGIYAVNLAAARDELGARYRDHVLYGIDFGSYFGYFRTAKKRKE